MGYQASKCVFALAAVALFPLLSHGKDAFSTGKVSVAGLISARLSDTDTNGFDHAFPPFTIPYQEQKFSHESLVSVSGSGFAKTRTGAWPNGVPYGGSGLKASSSASGGVNLTTLLTFSETEQDPEGTDSVFVIFTAYGNPRGEIEKKGSWSTASGSISVSGATSVSRLGSDPFSVNLFTTDQDVLVWANGQPMSNSKSIVEVTTDSVSLNFDFSTTAGEFRGPFGGGPIGNGLAAGVAFLTIKHEEPDSRGSFSLSDASQPSDLTELPGGSPDHPLPYIRVGSECSNSLDAFRLIVPVTQGYGTEVPVYSQYLDSSMSLLDDASKFARGYKFALENEGQFFKGFAIPAERPDSHGEFQIAFANTVVRLLAGEEIDFTQHVPGGVREFSLQELRESGGSSTNTPPSFPHAFRFSGDGTAIITVAAVPEPSALVLAGVGICVLIACQRAHRAR
jgi:hypothetical protein